MFYNTEFVPGAYLFEFVTPKNHLIIFAERKLSKY